MTENQINDKLVELVADEGMYITQAAEVWDARVFCTRRVLLPGEAAASWRDAAQKEKDEYEAFTPPQQRPCRTALTPLFEAAGAVFNDETGYYEMNGLTDLTEEDMEWMYNLPKTCGGLQKLDFSTFTVNGRYIRTNFPFTNVFMTCDTLSIYGQAKLEVLCLESITDFNRQPFQLKKFDTYANASLKRVMGEVYVKDVEKTSDLRNIYPTNLNLLEEFFLKFLCVSADIFTYSPLIKLECLDYLVTNARNTVPIIVAVHSTVYAKLMDEANAEWYAVNVAAREKQIAFATTETARAVALAARALPEVATEGGELLAPAGCYLTQAEDTPVADRLFLTRKVLLSGEDTARWRIGTEGERREQEDYFEQQLNN